jgi:hypothetical protein
MAVMLFPRETEETERLQWQAAAMAGAYTEWQRVGAPEKTLIDFHPWISWLWELPQSPQRVYQDGHERTARAALSGHVLLRRLSLARHHPEHAKLERAKALVQQFAGGGGSPSQSLIDKSWAHYKSASPLWAALVALVSRGRMPEAGNEEWLKFLAKAEAYRRAAEELRLFKPGATWEAPYHLSLPKAKAAISPLSEPMLSFLDEQFPG